MRAANAWAPASTARQSWPVATSTASTPFMMPLLWVAARYGSSSANRDAAAIAARTAGPAATSAASSASSTVQRTVTVRPSVRFDRMRSPGRPRGELGDPVGERLAQRVDEVGAHRVAAVDVEVHDEHAAVGAGRAPAAGRRARSGRRRARRAAAPAARASPSSSSARARSAAAAASTSAMSVTWIWPIITGARHLGRGTRAGGPCGRRSMPRRPPTAPRPPSAPARRRRRP